jgi:pyridoxamine 5'-phosphate oxidase
MDRSIADLRRNYTRDGLQEAQAGDDPMALFRAWFDQAVQADVPEPNAMTLCTVRSDGSPAARVVLLKDVRPEGMTFFTNHESDKGVQLAGEARVALVFLWLELERQVRVEGTATRIPHDEAARYFALRPRGSQIGAHASSQSRPVADRATMEARFAELEAAWADDVPVPCPPFWGGYLVRPQRWEFWQGRPSRMHDRLAWEADAAGGWSRVRLWP